VTAIKEAKKFAEKTEYRQLGISGKTHQQHVICNRKAGLKNFCAGPFGHGRYSKASAIFTMMEERAGMAGSFLVIFSFIASKSPPQVFTAAGPLIGKQLLKNATGCPV
jgi:hypothetical protein